MMALTLAGDEVHPGAKIADAPLPRAGAGEVVVAVSASGLTPMETHWRPAWRTPAGGPRSGQVVLGREFSGAVAEIGEQVMRWRVGDRVLGLVEDWGNGAAAERVKVGAEELLPLPPKLDPVLAAAIPLSGLTAWQGLIDQGRLQRGERVLIHGGAGGVGVFAIQIARWLGAHVITTASADALALCRALGADEAIDYRVQRFEDVVGQVDLVFDPIGGETQARSWKVLGPGGRLITIAGEEEDAPDAERAKAAGIDARFFIVERDQAALGELVRLASEGVVAPIVGTRVALRDATLLFDGKRRAPGKSVALVEALETAGRE